MFKCSYNPQNIASSVFENARVTNGLKNTVFLKASILPVLESGQVFIKVMSDLLQTSARAGVGTECFPLSPVLPKMQPDTGIPF